MCRNHPPCSLRRPSRGEAEALRRLRAAAIRQAAGPFYSPEQVDAWVSRFDAGATIAALRDGRSSAGYIAVVKGRTVGFAEVRFGERPHLWGLYVAPNFMRRGIGTALLRAVEGDTVVAGFDRLFIAASRNAVSFYTARGYAAGEAFEVEFSVGGVGLIRLEAVKLEKALRAN